MEQRRDYRQVPNFNLIPVEHRRPALSLKWLLLRSLLVLGIIAGALLSRNLYQEKPALGETSQHKQQEIAALEEELKNEPAQLEAVREEAKNLEEEIKATQEEVSSVDEETTTLEATIKTLESKHDAIINEWHTLTTNETDWSQVVAAFLYLPPEGVKPSSLKRSGTQVIVTGTVSNYAVLLQYQNDVLVSPVISRIVSSQSEKGSAEIYFTLVAEVKTEVK